jgi:hypothetical protein
MAKECDDCLSFFRGLVNALLLSTFAWGVIALAIFMLVK